MPLYQCSLCGKRYRRRHACPMIGVEAPIIVDAGHDMVVVREDDRYTVRPVAEVQAEADRASFIGHRLELSPENIYLERPGRIYQDRADRARRELAENPTPAQNRRCPHCDFVAMARGDLSNHLRRRHPNEMRQLSTADVLTPAVPIYRRRYECPDCNSNYVSFLILARHVRQEHPRQFLPIGHAQANQCLDCARIYETRAHLRAHYRDTHAPREEREVVTINPCEGCGYDLGGFSAGERDTHIEFCRAVLNSRPRRSSSSRSVGCYLCGLDQRFRAVRTTTLQEYVQHVQAHIERLGGNSNRLRRFINSHEGALGAGKNRPSINPKRPHTLPDSPPFRRIRLDP